MSILRITGGRRLDGIAEVQGAKNSVLPILAASLLASGESVIHNCPDLSDVRAAIKILEHLGAKVSHEGNTVIVDSSVINRCEVPHSLMREMRSSVIFLGAILCRIGEAKLSMPGGCELGPRPIDLHLSALRTMGADVGEDSGNIVCRAAAMTGGSVHLSIPSVGATENAMLAAVGCSGETVITNAAQEPEIADLGDFLNKLGADVRGAGTPTIRIIPAKLLNGAEHTVIPDRIAAATYLAAAAASGGSIELTGVCPAHIATVAETLEEMGCTLAFAGDRVCICTPRRLKAARPVATRPYPGFPTDAQPPLMAAVLKAEGTTVFVENIFTNRYRHADELVRMGADIKIVGKVAMVSGVRRLVGVPVSAADLRGGAALVVAALGAEGVTDISEVRHIDRGYDDIAGVLYRLGADIVRLPEG